MSESTIADLKERLRHAQADVVRLWAEVRTASSNGNERFVDLCSKQLESANALVLKLTDQLGDAQKALAANDAKVKEALEKAEKEKHEALEKVEKAEKERHEALKKAEKAEKDKDEALEKAEKAKLGKSIVCDKFPPPLDFIYATSRASGTSTAVGPKVRRWGYYIFRHLHDLPPRARGMGRTWHNYDSQADYSSESDVVGLIKSVMIEVAETYQQNCVISTQVQLAASTPDITLFRSFHQIPLTVVEVKKPRGAFCPRTRLQASRYLMNLRLIGGVSAPICVLTSYYEWQFCWHKYASPVAEAKTIKDVESFNCPMPEDADFASLCVSPVYSYDDPCLLLLLASLVVKATHTPRCDPIDESWCVYSAAKVHTRVKGNKPRELSPYMMVPKKTTNFFMIKPFKRGGEGMSFQMASLDGACCVAKFCDMSSEHKDMLTKTEKKKERERLCNAEKDRWVKAYGDNCGVRVAELARRPVVLMPYYEPLSDADWEKPGTMKKVLAHFKELATRDDEEDDTGKCRVFHQDIARRHVAWGDANHTRVRLIDWGHASNPESEPFTSNKVKAVLQSNMTPQQKDKRISRLVNAYLAAAEDALKKSEPMVPQGEVRKVEVRVPVLEDAFGGEFTEFKDPFTEMYDSDPAAFQAEMRRASKHGGRESSLPRGGGKRKNPPV